MTNLLNNWRVLALASAFFAGLTAIFGKVGVSNLNSNFATLVRTAVVLVILAAIVAWRGDWQSLSDVPRRSLVFLVLSALATGASWLCYYHALKLGPASRVAPIDKLSVVWAMALAVIFLGESLTWKTLVGGGLVAAGAVLLALP
jgi:transporter family protein